MINGAHVARAFHSDVVGPLLARGFPGLRYAVARLGSGSDVLGLDDELSRDHDWGCRLTVLVDAADAAAVPRLRDYLGDELPTSFEGLPVRFPVTWDQADTHNVEVATVGDFAASRLGVRMPLDTLDWLAVTGQGALEVTAGPVFVDTTRELGPARAALEWYPDEVWRYVLACGWSRVEQRLPMLGRTAQRDQLLQSRLLSARIVESLVHLAFLLCRAWMPYPKWRETMFRRLPIADELAGHVAAAVQGESWAEREAAIVNAASHLLEWQRAAGLPGPERAATSFWDRPFQTVDVARSLFDSIEDADLKRLPTAGCADQWVDSEQILANPHLRTALLASYRSWIAGSGIGVQLEP